MYGSSRFCCFPLTKKISASNRKINLNPTEGHKVMASKNLRNIFLLVNVLIHFTNMSWAPTGCQAL